MTDVDDEAVDDDAMDLMSKDIPDYHERLATLREHKGVARLPWGVA
jgi:hypothetical protein